MSSVGQRLALVEDTLAISALMATYHDACDGWDERGSHRDPKAIAALFTDDGVWQVTDRQPPPQGPDEIAALAVELQSIPWIVHLAVSPAISIEGDAATAVFKGLLRVRLTTSPRAVWSVGRYLVSVRRTEGGWRFRSMVWDPMSESERYAP